MEFWKKIYDCKKNLKLYIFSKLNNIVSVITNIRHVSKKYFTRFSSENMKLINFFRDLNQKNRLIAQFIIFEVKNRIAERESIDGANQ